MKYSIKLSLLPVFIYGILPILILVSAEIGLRVGGLYEAPRLFSANPLAKDSSKAVDSSFYRQYFEHHDHGGVAITAEWPFSIPEKKVDNVYRVFIFGESVALSDVPDYDFGLTRILQAMLEEANPGIRFELFNVACPALNSWVMRAAAQECSRLEPDLFIIYMGNNEFFGPFGPAWYPGDLPPAAARFDVQNDLQELRLVGLMNAFMPKAYRQVPLEPKAFFEQATRLHRDSPARARMYENFSANLSAMIASAKGVGASVLIGTVGSNLRDWAPSASLLSPELGNAERAKWEVAWQSGKEKQQVGNCLQALVHYEAAAHIDDSHAELHFRMATCLAQLGKAVEAQKHFQLARDFDAFPRRADSAINQAIRESAVSHSDTVVLADCEANFAHVSEGKVPGNEYFYDAVHMFFEGNYLVASTLFQGVQEHLARRNRIEPGTSLPLSLGACEVRLGHSAYLQLKHLQAGLEELRMSQQLDAAVQTAWLEGKISDLQKELPDDAEQTAMESMQLAAAAHPEDPYQWRAFAHLLVELNKLDEAAALSGKALETFPRWPGMALIRADMLARAGDKEGSAFVLETLRP